MCDSRQRAVSAGSVNDIAETCLGPHIDVDSGDGVDWPFVDWDAFRGCGDAPWLPDLQLEVGLRQRTSGEEAW